MVDTDKTDTEKIPLKWRLLAWWKGYDIADIKERIRLWEQRKQPKKSKKPAPEEKGKKILWDAERVKITQMIWGDGFCGPGGTQNVIDMSKLLALSPKMSAIVIGAGLGGPARVLAQEFGVWISGYESNRVLAEEGMKISVGKGLEKKAPITHIDLNKSPEFERIFDRAFSKESLYLIENKAGLVKIIFDQLKDDSLFLINDYVVRDHDSLTHPDVIDWIEHEPVSPYPMTSETLIYTLEKAGFQIRIQENITGQYLEMINEAWANAEKAVIAMSEDDEAARQNMFAILKEAELWNRRTKIMRSGELMLYRYLAHKPARSL